MNQSNTQNQDKKDKLKKALELLQQGDERGFEDVYAETYQYVYQRAKYMMDDEEEALDLVQEVYLSLHRDVKKIKNIESIFGWLKTTTYRQGLKQIEKHRKSGQLVENEVVVFGSITDDAAEIEENYARQKDLDFVNDCILQLSEEQKFVVLAYYYDDMKVEEIASFFGISTGTVKSRLYLARKKLKTMISDEEEKQGYKFYGFCGPLVTATLTSMLEKEIPVELIQRNNILENLHNLVQTGTADDIAAATGAVVSKTIGSAILTKIAEIGAKKVAITTVSVGLATATAVTGYVAVNNELVHFGGGEQDVVWEQEISDSEADSMQDDRIEPEESGREQEAETKSEVDKVLASESESEVESAPAQIEEQEELETEKEQETASEAENRVDLEEETAVAEEPYRSEARGTLRPQEVTSDEFSLSEEKLVDVTLLGSWPAIGTGTIASYGKYSITILSEDGSVVASQSGEIEEQDVSLQATLPAGSYAVILSNPGTYENEDSALDYYMMISY